MPWVKKVQFEMHSWCLLFFFCVQLPLKLLLLLQEALVVAEIL